MHVRIHHSAHCAVVGACSHMDNLDGAVAGVLGAAEAPAASGDGAAPAGADDGPGKYTLCGIVSHLGKNTGSGHYVCHVRKPDGSWVIFNDRKVGVQSPVVDCATLHVGDHHVQTSRSVASS